MTISEVLEQIEFPGWMWETFGQIAHGYLLRGKFERKDRETGEIGWGVTRWEFLSFDASPDAIVKTAWVIIELTTRHEAMEFFKYKGKRVFDPHVPVDRLISLQEQP